MCVIVIRMKYYYESICIVSKHARTDTDTDTDRQTDRHRHRYRHRQTDRQTDLSLIHI